MARDPEVEDSAALIGERIRQWRMVLGLSQELVAERADVSVQVLVRIEHGELGVRFGSFLSIVNVLGLDEKLTRMFDPLETDLGRMRAANTTRQRVKKVTQ
ncbi:helix-turn-helix domain-containing protein [Pseudarthrobacter sp. J1763]|uniref:helix-turn-helix domain-containing protein n=1 Tax=Pseudarthrobacter sp. J1763 TaxID=3420445 RepID=UPI003D273C02